MMEKHLSFPKGFLWGSAISAHQTEGNNINSDWWAWENSPQRIKKLQAEGKDPADYRSGQACDFYHRFESDFDLLTQLHQNAFRLSIEWARIEPKEGEYDEEEIRHYQQVLSALKKRNIKSFVTLHHFTLPLWFASKGGFEVDSNVRHFVSYARLAAERFSGLVNFWITINEPEIYASHAYYFGRYPPQKTNFWLMMKVVKNLISAHNLASDKMRNMSPKPIGMAYHLIDLMPASIFSRFTRNLMHYLNNEYILRRTISHCDFIGVNYYGHSHVRLLGRRASSRSGHETTDLGWGIHPEGMERALLGVKKYQKPVYVTENGIADVADTRREKFIRNHLYYVLQAVKRGVDVRGYLYWSLLDNFEWAHGFVPRFGLIAVDYKTQERTIRKSALAYDKICTSNTLKAI